MSRGTPTKLAPLTVAEQGTGSSQAKRTLPDKLSISVYQGELARR